MEQFIVKSCGNHDLQCSEIHSIWLITNIISCWLLEAASNVRLAHFFQKNQPIYNNWIFIWFTCVFIANSVGYHDIGRVASSAPSYLADVANLGGSSKLFLRLHAAFMLVAWIGTASVGILLARYYKQTWVGSQLCGKDQWFAVRICGVKIFPPSTCVFFSLFF